MAAFVARLGTIGAVVFALLLGSSRSALAHATLVRADPALNARLKACPSRVRLEFSEAIEPAMAGISIASANGRRIALPIAGDPHDVHAVIAPLSCLGDGSYRVLWRVVSEDGHPVDGAYAFAIGTATVLDTSVAAGSMAMSAHDSAMTAEAEGTMHNESANWGPSMLGAPVTLSVLRGLALGALLGFTGLLLYRSGAPLADVDRADAVARWLVLLSPLLLIVHFTIWVMNTHAQHMLSTESMGVASGTGMGHRELLRIVFALLALSAYSLARQVKLAMVAGAAAMLVSSAIGHTAAIAPLWAIPTKALHLIASAAWIGGVLWLLTLDRADVTRFARETARVSRVAMLCVIVVGISGLVQTFLFLSTPADLVHSSYGLLVVAKMVGTVILIGFGAHHRMRAMPKPGDARWSPGLLATTLRGEIVVMTLVVLIGGLLSYVPPPQSMLTMPPSTVEPRT